MENRNIDDLIKKGEELAKEHESIRNELPQEIKDKMGGIAQSIYDDNKIVTDIIRKII